MLSWRKFGGIFNPPAIALSSFSLFLNCQMKIEIGKNPPCPPLRKGGEKAANVPGSPPLEKGDLGGF